MYGSTYWDRVFVSGIAIYFEKKSDIIPPDLSKHTSKLDEASKNSIIIQHGGTSDQFSG